MLQLQFPSFHLEQGESMGGVLIGLHFVPLSLGGRVEFERSIDRTPFCSTWSKRKGRI